MYARVYERLRLYCVKKNQKKLMGWPTLHERGVRFCADLLDLFSLKLTGLLGRGEKGPDRDRERTISPAPLASTFFDLISTTPLGSKRK